MKTYNIKEIREPVVIIKDKIDDTVWIKSLFDGKMIQFENAACASKALMLHDFKLRIQ